MKKIQILILIIAVSLQLSPLVASSNTNDSELITTEYTDYDGKPATKKTYKDGLIKIICDTETYTQEEKVSKATHYINMISTLEIESRTIEIDTQDTLEIKDLFLDHEQKIDRLTGEIID